MNEQLINELCEKFHTTVDNLIPVYAKYAMSKDIGGSIICIILVAITILYFVYLKHYMEKNDIYDTLDIPVHHIILSVCFAIAAIICFIAICMNIYDYVLWSNYPSMRFLDHVADLASLGGK